MHLLDTYALATASKIDKPFIFENFFPLVHDKYITFQAQTKFDSKNYSYWQDVINLIFPVLEKHGIKIVQIGLPNEWSYQYVMDVRGRTDINQLAYIIRRAQLHLGSDSLGVHLASAFDVPIVGLYSVSQSTVSGPRFGNKDKHIIFDAYLRTRNGKPTYAAEESPKCVNLIKPEEIANAVFKLLNINEKAPFETVFIGERYSSQMIREFVPNVNIQVENPQHPIEIRMDIEFNEEVLAKQLMVCKGIILTNKRINPALLSQFKPNIAALVYIIEDNDDPQFIHDIKHIGLQIILITYLPPEKIEEKKINYYEFGRINDIKGASKETVEELKKDIDNLYYRCNKIVCSHGKLYLGNAARVSEEEITSDFNYNKVIDHPEFWKEIQFTTIVKKV